MKSLRDISLDITEDAYHAYPAWSYSMIARYAREGFPAIASLRVPITPTPAMKFGTLLDKMITEPGRVDNEFAVIDQKLQPKDKELAQELFKVTSLPFNQIPQGILKGVCESVQIGNYGVDAKMKKLVAVKDYYDILRTGKEVVTEEDWNDAVTLATALKSSPNTKRLLRRDTKDVEYIYQAKYLVKMLVGDEYIRYKFMPDLLIVDHADKTIQPVDLKYTELSVFDFAQHFVKMRYDLQAASYTDGLITLFTTDGYEDYKSYRILPYLFIVIDRNNKIPLVFDYPALDKSQRGGLSFNDYTYKSWRTLLSEIIEYERSGATVPSYLSAEKPNSIIDLLSKK